MQPDITPVMLDEIKAVTESTKGIPYSPNLAQGHRYLGGTLIPLISHPEYQNFLPTDMLYPENLQKNYRDLIVAAMTTFHRLQLAEYVGSRVPPDDTADIDDHLLILDLDITSPGGVRMAQYFLGRRVPISESFLWDILSISEPKLLRQALALDSSHVAGLADAPILTPRLAESDDPSKSGEILAILYTYPKFYEAFDPTAFVKETLQYINLSNVLPLVLQDPRIKTEGLFELALEHENIEPLKVFIQDHRNMNGFRALGLAIMKADQELQDLILNHSRSAIIFRDACNNEK